MRMRACSTRRDARIRPHLLLAPLLALLSAGAARASCTTGNQAATFPAASGYAVSAGQSLTTSTTAGLNCTAALLGLLGSATANVTITSTNNFLLKDSLSGDTIPYQASADSGGTTVFQQGVALSYTNNSLLSLIGLGGSSSFAPSFYYKVTGSPTVTAPRTYTDTLDVHWVWSMCSGILVGSLCVGGVASDSGDTHLSFTVTLSVLSDCRVSAPNIGFGSQPLASQFQPVSQAALVNCTKGTPYTVAFSAGASNVARPWRTMSDGAGHSLQYNIYLNDGTTIWDTTNPQAGTAPGTGSTTPSIAQPYVAKVNPAQTTPPAGQYSDTVNLIVSF